MIELRKPRPDDEDAFLKARSSVPADNPTFLRDYRQDMTYIDFLRLLEDHSAGRGTAADVAPSSFLLRSILDASLDALYSPHTHSTTRKVAGHIGYASSSEFRNAVTRRKSFTRRSASAYDELGLDRVMVTCDDDNAASIRVIEKSGGIFQDTYQYAMLRRPKRRYWIDASGAQPNNSFKPKPLRGRLNSGVRAHMKKLALPLLS
jgi:predicted acetyltransferase